MILNDVHFDAGNQMAGSGLCRQPLDVEDAEAAKFARGGTADGTALSPNRIMQLGLGFWDARVLLSAIELGLFTELAIAPLEADTLQQRLDLRQRDVRDFLDALVVLGMLERHADTYSNTPETDYFLDRNKPSYIGGMLDRADMHLHPAWGSLAETLRTGQPQSGAEGNKELFDVLHAYPVGLTAVARATTSVALLSAPALARRFPWAFYRSFIEVGAAQGALLVEISRTHPHLTGASFDLPCMRPIFGSCVRRHKLTDRPHFQEGDFFKDPLAAADVFILGQILKAWDLDTKRALSAKVFAALPEHGVLIVCDQMRSDERRENAAGFDYSAADCVGWMQQTGFIKVRHEHLCGTYTMVTGIKPPDIGCKQNCVRR